MTVSLPFQVRLMAAAVLIGLLAVHSRAQDEDDDKQAAKLAKSAADKSNPVASRLKAMKKLADMGDKGKAASRGLAGLLLDTSPKVREGAGDALRAVNPDLHKPLKTLIIDEDYYKHYESAVAVGRMGKDGTAGTPVLLGHLKAHTPQLLMLKDLNADWLEIDDDSPCLIPIIDALAAAGLAGDKTALTKEEKLAADALTKNGTRLLAVVADSVALARVAGHEPEVMKELALYTLTHPNNVIRFGGLAALSTADPRALKSALPTLRKLKDDKIAQVRELAVELCGKVEKAEPPPKK